MEEWKEILSWLNECAGLFALLAFIAAIAVPTFIYKRQRKNEMRRLQDEYEAMQESFRQPLTETQRQWRERKVFYEKTLKKK